MKYIVKQVEPLEFSQWKALENSDWKPAYSDLRGAEKGAVKASLLVEQGYICCYCNRRISSEDSHIEHLEAQSADEAGRLNYANMLASCLRETYRTQPLHCGKARENRPLPVTPLQPGCERRFRFSFYGDIHPADDADAEAAQTISLLALDKLRAGREAVIRRFLEGLGTLTAGEKAALERKYRERDSEGRFTEYCTAILYVLRTYY